MRPAVILTAFSLIFGLVGCTGGTSASPSAASPSVLASGTAQTAPEATAPGSPETTSMTFAITEGSFAEIAPFKWQQLMEARGIQAKITTIPNGDTIMRSIIAGQVDMGVCTILGTILLAKNSGSDLRLVLSDNVAPEYELLARRGEITKTADYNGKRLGIQEPGAISDILPKYALKQIGVDVSTLKVLQIGGTGPRLAALVSDNIDIGVIHAADALEAMEKFDLESVLTIGKVVPDLLQRGMCMTRAFISEHPNLAQIAVDEYMNAVRWSASDKEGYIALAKQHMESTPSDSILSRTYDTYETIGLFGVNGGVSDEQLMHAMSINEELGTLTAPLPAIDDWVETGLVQSYLQRNGTQERTSAASPAP